MDNINEMEEAELSQPLSQMINPPSDDFINNPMRRSLMNVCIWCPIYTVSFWISYYLSSSYVDKLKRKLNDKTKQKNTARTLKEKIKRTVRTYRYNFQKFNDETCPTCFETNADGTDYIRGSVNCITNRNPYRLQNMSYGSATDRGDSA